MSLKNDKIKILHIITGLGNGGAERVLFNLIANSNNKIFDAQC